MAVYCVLNKKGGAGKTTLAMNLAAASSFALTAGDPDVESPVAAVSIDPQGSMEWWADRIEAMGNALPFSIFEAYNDPAILGQIDQQDGIEHVYIDTPGWLGDDEGSAESASFAATLEAVIGVTDLFIVPITVGGMSFLPTVQTIEDVIKPSGIPFVVVINNWAPSTDKSDLEELKDLIDAMGWPRANTTIRGYKVHARAVTQGLVSTLYPSNRVALEARGDFDRLAVELGLRNFAKEGIKLAAEKEARDAAAAAEAEAAEVAGTVI